MKVVVRSSSLLFTLLSIVFHVPIRRTKRHEEESESTSGEQPGKPKNGSGTAPDSRLEAAAVGRGRRQSLF